MRRISSFTPEQIIEYNLRENGTQFTIFLDAQNYRVLKARQFVEQALIGSYGPADIIELGCSAGDIAGAFSDAHHVVGVDVTPSAVESARERYPAMKTILGKAEDFGPRDCDVLILTEFLEHIDDPEGLVREWLPYAKHAVIGHPLEDPGGIEPGHIWSYELADFNRWFDLGGHRLLEAHLFAGPFPQMVMGVSERI